MNDNNGDTPAQITAFGENFALQSTNPNLGTYQLYNPEHKKTDMDYLRLQGKIGDISIDDTGYTYAYVNKTISSTTIDTDRGRHRRTASPKALRHRRQWREVPQ